MMLDSLSFLVFVYRYIWPPKSSPHGHVPASKCEWGVQTCCCTHLAACSCLFLCSSPFVYFLGGVWLLACSKINYWCHFTHITHLLCVAGFFSLSLSPTRWQRFLSGLSSIFRSLWPSGSSSHVCRNLFYYIVLFVCYISFVNFVRLIFMIQN